MNSLKKIGRLILVVLFIQIATYYTVGKNSMIKVVGLNYESYVLQYEENAFKDVGVVSNLNPSWNQIQLNFTDFKLFNLKVYNSISDSPDPFETDHFYLYGFDSDTKNPFWINSIYEFEAAQGYGASWESKYIWIIYKWVLLEKINTGIS